MAIRSRLGPKASCAGRVSLRVIGGDLRGRLFEYDGDEHIRPMKDRLREAVFNLIGPAVRGKQVVDLFGGTGALSFEALSRGAISALLIERRFPAADQIGKNAQLLKVTDRCRVETADTFFWMKRNQPSLDLPWLVFVSPPYDFFHTRQADLLELVQGVLRFAPATSIIVVESDEHFDMGLLPQAQHWDVRVYPPAKLGLLVVNSN